MNTEEVSIIRKEDNVALEVLKQQSQEIAKKCATIVVTNATERHIAMGLLGDANKFVTKGEKFITDMQRPIKKLASQIKQDYIKPIDDGVTVGKKVIQAYDAKEAEIAAKAQRAIQAIKDKIEKYKNDTIRLIDECKTDAEIKAVFEGHVKANPTDPDFANYLVDLKSIREGLLEYLKQKRTIINSKSVESVAKAEEAIVVTAQIMEEKIESVAAVEIAAAVVPASKGITKTWKAEVIDFSAVPDSLKMIDMVKVNEWKKSLQGLGELVDGKDYIENGIRYFQESSVRLG